MEKGFQLDDLAVKVAPTGASDSGIGLPCGVIILVWAVLN